ncbi:MAG: hypothetical protein OEY66_07215 [Gammaproteobacteria bacterium]|nr:hypothetical protein [Gammaproteobacteria bacterium]
MISTTNYLSQTQSLLDLDEYTDGCTTPFKTFIHRWLKKSRVLCAAHDFGGRGLIKGVRPGWHNNLHTLIAHWSQPAPIYWVWGSVVAFFTLFWAVWHHDWGINFFDLVGFHVFLLMIIAVCLLVKYKLLILSWGWV